MEAILDRFGRIVIPKRIRANLNLAPGTHIRIEESDERIVLTPSHGEPHVTMKNGVLVFSGTALKNVDNAVAEHRKQRMRDAGSGK